MGIATAVTDEPAELITAAVRKRRNDERLTAGETSLIASTHDAATCPTPQVRPMKGTVVEHARYGAEPGTVVWHCEVDRSTRHGDRGATLPIRGKASP